MYYIGFPILSLIYIILLLTVYFSKKRIDLFENKVVSTLMVINAIGLTLEILCHIVLVFFKIQDTLLGITILKSYVYYMYVFDWVLTGYICLLTNKKHHAENNNKKKYYQKSLMVFSPIIIIGFFITFFTKLEYYNVPPKYYTYGTSINFLVYTTCIIAPFWIYRCMKASATKKSRESNTREYNIRIGTTLLGIVLVGAIAAFVQLVDRSMLIITSAHTIMLVLMYFTIENPDLQMVEELSINKKLTEQNYEEKTNFIFKISQELKKPLQDIAKLSNDIYETSNGKIKEQAQQINMNSKQLYSYVNNALDISNMDIKNLKIVEGKYNTKNFFEEIELRIKSEIKNQNKNLELRYNISKNIPEYLSGDNAKLKQIILSIIFDSIKHTEKGFIELNINTIVKYGICRLIIEISDSGDGMSLEKINTILQTTGDLTKEELDRIDKLNISLVLTHKIIKTLNGSFIIKSEPKQGSSFLIIIDQKIEKQDKTILEKKLESYAQKITTNRKVLLVSTDNNILNEITKLFEKTNIDIITSLYGKDVLNRLNTNEKFELIIVDDELTNESGIDILNKIKDKTQEPVILLLNKNKEFMSKHYIEDGFDEYLIKEELENEIKKLNKYL